MKLLLVCFLCCSMGVQAQRPEFRVAAQGHVFKSGLKDAKIGESAGFYVDVGQRIATKGKNRYRLGYWMPFVSAGYVAGEWHFPAATRAQSDEYWRVNEVNSEIGFRFGHGTGQVPASYGMVRHHGIFTVISLRHHYAFGNDILQDETPTIINSFMSFGGSFGLTWNPGRRKRTVIREMESGETERTKLVTAFMPYQSVRIWEYYLELGARKDITPSIATLGGFEGRWLFELRLGIVPGGSFFRRKAASKTS